MNNLFSYLFAALSMVFTMFAHAVSAETDLAERRVSTLEKMLTLGEQRRAEAILIRLIRKSTSAEESAIYGDLYRYAVRNHPLQFHGTFGMLPSTNVTRAASATQFSTLVGEFDIDDGGNAQSGLGLRVNVGATYRLPIDQTRSFHLQGQIGRTYYDDENLRNWTGRLGAEYIHRKSQQTFRSGIFASHTYYDSRTSDAADLWKYGLTANLSEDRAHTTRTLAGRLEYRDYVDQDSRDGPFIQAGTSWSMPLGERGQLRWGAGIERHTPEVAYQRYLGARGHLGYSHKISDTTRLGVTLRGVFNRYDQNFAQVDYPRADDIYSLSVAATNSKIKIGKAVPTLSCTYTDHQSNVALYETSYTDCSATFSFDF